MKTSRHKTRQGSIYIAVTGVAIIVALIGFTSIHLSRLELRRCSSQQDDSYARLLAQSSVEMAIALIEDLGDPAWRGSFTSDTVNTITPDYNFKPLYFRYIDTTDGNLDNNDTDPVVIQGIGLCGKSTFVYSVDYEPSVTSSQQVSPPILHSYDAGTNAQENVTESNFLGHHFIPSLPAGATSWSITHIDIWLEQHGTPGSTLHVRCYHSDANDKPGTLIETVSFPESVLPSNYAWHTVNFSSATGLTPGAGISFTLEGEGGGNTLTVPYQAGLSQSNSHLLRGGWGGWNTQPSQSFQFRVNGTYTTEIASGEFTITPGSWQRVVVP